MATTRGTGQAQARIKQVYPHSAIFTYATDTFTRTVSGGFGSANVGGAYTLSGTASDFAVTGSVGTHTHTVSNAVHSARLAINALDQDVTVQVTIDKLVNTATAIAGIELRLVNGSNFYRCSMHIANAGGVQGSLQVTDSGTTTILVGPSAIPRETVVPGTMYNIRGQVLGTNPTTLRVKIWQDGTTEPADWDFSTTDSTASVQVAAGVGLRSQLSTAVTNVPIVFTWDNLSATSPLTGGFGQAQADIKATSFGFAQALADIEAVGRGHGQAQADIEAIGQGFAQAQGTIKAISFGYSQAQSDIKAVMSFFGQSQAWIQQTALQYANAQAQILLHQNVQGKAQGAILATSIGVGNAQATINPLIILPLGVAQAQAFIFQRHYLGTFTLSDTKLISVTGSDDKVLNLSVSDELDAIVTLTDESH